MSISENQIIASLELFDNENNTVELKEIKDERTYVEITDSDNNLVHWEECDSSIPRLIEIINTLKYKKLKVQFLLYRCKSCNKFDINFSGNMCQECYDKYWNKNSSCKCKNCD